MRDKIIAMEALREGISQEEVSLERPKWHKELLDEREKLVEAGKAKFIDWEVAKKEIRQAIS